MGMGNSRKIDYSLGEENDKFMIRQGRKRRDKEHPHSVVRWGRRDGGGRGGGAEARWGGGAEPCRQVQEAVRGEKEANPKLRREKEREL